MTEEANNQLYEESKVFSEKNWNGLEITSRLK